MRNWLESSTSHLNLYAFRFFYSLSLGYFAVERGRHFWKTRSDGTFQGLFFLLPFQGKDVSEFQMNLAIGLMALAFSLFAFGILPRMTGLIAWMSYINIFLPMNYSFRPYDDNLVFFNLLILTVAPIGSISTFRINQVAHEKVPAWPLELIKLNLGLVYFAAFVSKLINSGVGWANGVTLQYNLYERYLMTGNLIALWFADHLWICFILSIFTLFAEATFWTVLLKTPLTPFVILAGLGMHLGVYFLMTINFVVFVLAYFVFIPYDRIFFFLTALKARFRPQSQSRNQ